jgi:hypothetical protein
VPKQVLITTPKDAAQALEVHGQALHAAHAQLVAILRGRLGQNHGDLLAQPLVRSDGSIEWSTQAAGAVAAADSLPADERERLQQRAERIVSDIRALAQQLQSESAASQVVGHMLERAVSLPPGAWLYSVGGKPVYAMWGHAAPGTALPPVPAPGAAPPPVPAAAPAVASAAHTPAAGAAAVDPVQQLGAATLASGAGAPPPAPPPPSGGGWKRWLLWALLALLLLALLLWGLRRCGEQATTADAALDDRIAQAERRNAELEDELRRKRAATMMCVPEPPPAPASAPVAAASAPEPAPSAPPPPVVASAPPPPPPDPLEELKKRVAAAGTNCERLGALLDKEPLLKRNTREAGAIKQQIMKQLEQNCRERAIKEARNLCPGQRPPQLAPEMAIVFDASGSMNFSLDATDEQIRQAGAAAQVEAMLRAMMGQRGGGASGLPPHLTREPRRITVAKPAATSVVQRVPSDVNIGLVMVDDCPAARPVGMYAPGQRGALIGQIQGIQPRGGTPLADGMAKAGEMVDGVNREALIVVVSDGTESCGRDPCAVAADLKRRKPHLRINVVDITGTGAGNCAARITGGQVYTARQADEVAKMMERAAQEAMGPGNCKK